MNIDWKKWGLVVLGISVMLAGGGVVIIYRLAWYWAVAVFGFCFACINSLAKKQERQHFEAYFSGRPILKGSEFGQHYFPPEHAEIATKLRKILSNHVGIDLERMNQTDRFIEDFRMDDYDSMSTVEYVIAIEKEFEFEISDAAAEKLTTFQSVVDYVAEALKNKGKQLHASHPRKD